MAGRKNDMFDVFHELQASDASVLSLGEVKSEKVEIPFVIDYEQLIDWKRLWDVEDVSLHGERKSGGPAHHTDAERELLLGVDALNIGTEMSTKELQEVSATMEDSVKTPQRSSNGDTIEQVLKEVLGDRCGRKELPDSTAEFLNFMLKYVLSGGDYGGSCNEEQRYLLIDVLKRLRISFPGVIKQLFFYFDSKMSYLNHGAFGGVFRPIMELQVGWMRYIELQPSEFFMKSFFQMLIDNIRCCAKYIQAKDPREVAIVPSTTYAMNVVLKCLIQHAGKITAVSGKKAPDAAESAGTVTKTVDPDGELPEANKANLSRNSVIHSSSRSGTTGEGVNSLPAKVVYFSFVYPSTTFALENVIDQLAGPSVSTDEKSTASTAASHIELHEINIPLTIKSFDDVADRLASTLKLLRSQNYPILAVVIDAIPYSLPISLPVGELSDICRQIAPDAFVIVDGAHLLGATRINVDSFNADFVLLSAHKWMSAPKGTTLFWCPLKHQTLLSPLIASYGLRHGFAASHSWTGLNNYTGWLVMKQTIALAELLAPLGVAEVNRELLDKMAIMLSSAWQTALPIPLKLFHNSPMRLILLPKFKAFENRSDIDMYECNNLRDVLFYEFKVECRLIPIQGELYARISVHVYNTMEDAEKLRDGVLELSKREDI